MPKQNHSDIDRLLAALSYVWVLFVIPYTLGHKKAFVFSHAQNGLALFVFEMILMAIGFVPFIGWSIALAGWVFVVICCLLGMGHAMAGQSFKVPLLDQYLHDRKRAGRR